MKTKSLVWIIVFSCMLLIACTEEYDLNLHPETKLVIDAEITNGKPPYYTHLGLSGSLKSDLNQWIDDALIIISDDEGVVDTLIPAADSIWTHYTKYTTQSGEDSIVWYPVYDNMGAIDSMLIYDHRLATQCYFQTTKLQGKAGHTYYLKAEWRGHTYTAECTMPSAIKIDTITHRQADKFKDGAVGEIPYVWFHDNPNEDNYYVFKKGWQEEPLSYSNGQYTWSVSIISDELLQQGFKGMDLCGGVATESWRKDNWDFSLPIGKKRGNEWVENEMTTHIGVGGCLALGAPKDMDVSMVSSGEIFWTACQYDYTKKGSHSTWSVGFSHLHLLRRQPISRAEHWACLMWHRLTISTAL